MNAPLSTQPQNTVQVLIERGLVTEEQVAAAQEAATRRGVPLLRELIESKLVDRTEASRAFAEAANLEFVELVEMQLDQAAVATVPAEQARRMGVIPIGWDGRRLVVATSDPTNVIALDDLRVLTGTDIKIVYAARRDIEDKLAKVYRAESELGDISADLADTSVATEAIASIGDSPDDAPIVRFVNLLISQAVADRASDIHVEPTEHDLRVRYRIDGVLHEMMRSPKKLQAGVVSRLKIMADINIAERRVPQDGRISVTQNGSKIDLRVATLPTVWGEKVVLRILDNKTALLGLDQLGFSDGNLSRYATAYRKPYGMIMVTGPTGSGKSTSLYATLNIVSRPEINVITVEDPVEYRIPNINQVQVNTKGGLTFARALRSILRADPDVVLIGEIRDTETARIAVEAALTGHLVLTTLHTNDAPSSINRLVEMGVEPFLVASAMDCVVAQRLCRRLCSKCKESYVPSDKELLDVGFPWQPDRPLPTLYRPVGCASCSRTGYRGRLALHEVMEVTEEIERLTVTRSSTDAVARAATAAGMVPLRQDGWLKVLAGDTSVEEVLRVVA
jgi:type IV pilus assembly protein PilB